ncbi:MAG: hypothetical protein HY511_00635 [Actinobacteria bacterium]|nr:hypothetical protein [Actinomycetota bacterium]
MEQATAERLQPYRERVRRLAAELAQTGFLTKGTVIRHYARCGNPDCRCQRDPAQRHGPYYRWSTKVAGKTVTRHLGDDEGRLYVEWIANRQRVRQIIDQIERISERAAAAALDLPDRSASRTARTKSRR